MPATLLQPGVYIEEVPSGVRTITGVATSIALFIGWAPRGAIDRAERIASFPDYIRLYGGLDRRTVLGHSVKHFFDNGGSTAYVVRLADPVATPATAAPAPLTITARSPGLWGENYRIRTTQRVDDATRYRIEVLDKANKDAVVESFENLSSATADQRYAGSVINGRSLYITVAAASAAAPADGTVDLGGAVEGAVLVPGTNPFHTPLLASFGPGTVTDHIDLFNIVCVPGETHLLTLAQLQKHCHDRRAFLIIDAGPLETVGTLSAVNAIKDITGVDALNSAIYFPWVRAADPLHDGALTDFPPCGFVAGVYARTDATRGVWKAPAGSDASLTGATGFTVSLSDAQNGVLNPLGINCLRTMPVYGNVVWGARTLHGQNDRGSEWKYVPVRRFVLFLEESLYRSTQWVVFEPNDEPLWAQIRLNVGAFLHGLFRQGALQGLTPREAYFVKCDKETTTQADRNMGIVNIFVGIAPLKPAEFVVIHVQQIAGEIPT